MAPPRRRPAVAVDEKLFRDPRPFDLFQAVRLLAWLYPERRPPGQAVDPRREMVRFRSRLRLDFPGGDVGLARRARSPELPAELAVDVMSLGGARGPLPLWVTELVQDRLGERDTAAADFLDLFHHRLVSLLYRARVKHRPQEDALPPHETAAGRALFALVGLGEKPLRDRLEVPDRALLHVSGLIAPGARSRVGLERLLRGLLEVPVRVRPFQGRFLPIEPAQQTFLGYSGRNQVLGKNAVLGIRAWSPAAGAAIEVGPVSYRDYLGFLPIGSRHRTLRSVARFYVRDELDLSLELSVRPAERPALRLGTAAESLLGWNARLLSPARVAALEAPAPDATAPRGELRLGTVVGARLGWTSWLFSRPETPAEAAPTARVRLGLHRLGAES